MNRHVEVLTATIDALRFPSAASATWFGQPVIRIASFLRREMTPQLTRISLEYLLHLHLYENVYCPGTPTRVRADPVELAETARTAFVERLSAANLGSGRWEAGWQLIRVTEDAFVVRRHGIQVSTKHALRHPQGGAPQEIGGEVSLRQSKELTSVSPGFYVAIGDQGSPVEGASGLIRWYWNLTPAGAETFVRLFTKSLNQAGLAFQLKVLSNPTTYWRCDAGVLYAARQDHQAVEEVVGSLLPRLRIYLKDAVPAFTKRLAPGVGVAEDPGGGDSFGQSRCKILASGLVRAQQNGDRTIAARLQTVVDHFDEQGISMSTPHVNRGSSDVYTLPAPGVGARTAPARRALETTEADHFGMAVAVGRRLCTQAIWHGSECTWIGRAPAANHGAGDGTEVTYRPIDAHLYAGTAGVAWFLGELSVASADEQHSDTALGAIRHALRVTEDAGQGALIGLFEGAVGVALVAARLGLILKAPDLAERAWVLLKRVRSGRGDMGADLLGGAAGAVIGLLVARQLVDQPALNDLAASLGEHLLRTAEETAGGSSWRWNAQACFRNPTGYSHGTAGITHALLELFDLTGDERYRACAERATAYDREAFDAAAGNWADYRLPPGRRPRVWVPRYAVAWCHGAPGIAVARLRAYQLLGDPTDHADAVIALATTRAALEASLSASTPDFCLCHGLAGNVEIVERGERQLLISGQRNLSVITDHGITRYADESHGDDDPPGLMHGLAGIGGFYLRRAGVRVPSPLFLGQEPLDDLPGTVLLNESAPGDQTAPVISA
jgi:hypothetical protein